MVDERPLGGRDPDLGVGVFLVGDRRDDEADEERPRVGVADPKGVDFPELALELAFDRGGVPSGVCEDEKAFNDKSTEAVPSACRPPPFALPASLRNDIIEDLAELKLDRTLPALLAIDDARDELPDVGPGDGGCGRPTCWQYIFKMGAISG